MGDRPELARDNPNPYLKKVNLRAQKTDRTRRMLERKGREWELVTDNLVSFFVTNRNDTSREQREIVATCTLS